MKKISKKQLFAVLLVVGLATGGNCMAMQPTMSPKAQELVYRIDFFNTIINAFKAIINAPAVYIKNLYSIQGLDQKTKDKYNKVTTGHTKRYNKILMASKRKLEKSRANAMKELATYDAQKS